MGDTTPDQRRGSSIRYSTGMYAAAGPHAGLCDGSEPRGGSQEQVRRSRDERGNSETLKAEAARPRHDHETQARQNDHPLPAFQPSAQAHLPAHDRTARAGGTPNNATAWRGGSGGTPPARSRRGGTATVRPQPTCCTPGVPTVRATAATATTPKN